MSYEFYVRVDALDPETGCCDMFCFDTLSEAKKFITNNRNSFVGFDMNFVYCEYDGCGNKTEYWSDDGKFPMCPNNPPARLFS